MQSVIAYILFLITGTVFHAQNNIELSYTWSNSDHEKIMLGLCNEEEEFLDLTYCSVSSEISNHHAQLTFTNTSDGTYAISSFHDEDNNGTLNQFMGVIPTESYGCSIAGTSFFELPNGRIRNLK